jgi:hypothetical protein
MRAQMEFAATETFQTFLTGLTRFEKAPSVIHAIFIDIHPVWKIIMDYRRMTGFGDFLPVFPNTASWMTYAAHYAALCQMSKQAGGPYDLEEPSVVWKEVCHAHKKDAGQPFIVKVYVLPSTSETLESRRQIEGYAREQNFFTSVIDSPMAVLAAQVEGGADISATGPGTLGGFLKDQHGDLWGVTCGHVAQTPGSPAALAGGQGNLGCVAHSNFSKLSPQSQSAVCNQYVVKSRDSVDAALIDVSKSHRAMDSVLGLGRVDTIFDRTRLNSGSIVSMTGAMSGTNDFQIGGYGVTAKVQLSSGAAYYCFSDVFDFAAVVNAPGWVPRRLVQAASPWPLQGDSGSWLCFNHSPNLYAYFGSMIAVRGGVGVAIFADSLIQWAKTDHGLQLGPL